MKTLIAAYALICTAALVAGYVSGYALSEAVPVLVLITLFGVASEAARSFIVGGSMRSQSSLLRRLGRIFDMRAGLDPAVLGWTDRYPIIQISGHIAGRDADFSIWRPQDHPEVPAWATLGERPEDDRDPALALRISCMSPVEFTVKNWGISSGPPFRRVKLDPAFALGEAVNFTTTSVEAFTFWRSREDCRGLAQNLIRNGILQISVTGLDITGWWQLASTDKWDIFGARLPSIVNSVLQLAHALEGREDSRPEDRKCRCCHANLGRGDAYCSHCGAAWWTEQPATTRTH